MMKTIIGVFENTHDAHRMMETLRAHPLGLKDVAIIAKARDMHTHSTEDVVTSDGALWGGLVGLAALALPGVGPFISGITLIDFSGISADEAIGYERAIRAGKTLVAIKAHDEDAAEVQRMLMRRNPDQAHGDQASPAAVPAWVMLYDEHGQRVEHAQAVDAASDPRGVSDDSAAGSAGAGWTSGEVVGAGQGEGPRKDTGSYDARQFAGAGQGAGPQQTGDAQPWTSGEVVGAGQGEGPRKDTGTPTARQWVGEGQGDQPATDAPTKRSD